MKSYAEYLHDELSAIPGTGIIPGAELENLTGPTPDRYALYHIGPVLVGSVSSLPQYHCDTLAVLSCR